MRNPLISVVVACIGAILLSGCNQVNQVLEGLNLPGSGGADRSTAPSREDRSVSAVGRARALLSDSPTFAQARDSGTVRIESGNTVFIAGFRPIAGGSQNPIIARYDNGSLTWSRVDYETGRADGRAYGLIYDPSRNLLYAAFTVDRGQSESVGFERFTRSGWLTGYGPGGRAKASVIAQIDPASGAATRGSFITSELTNGRTTAVIVTELSFPDGNSIEIKANAQRHPRKADRSRYSCSSTSQYRRRSGAFNYTLVLDNSLASAISASAPGCE